MRVRCRSTTGQAYPASSRRTRDTATAPHCEEVDGNRHRALAHRDGRPASGRGRPVGHRARLTPQRSTPAKCAPFLDADPSAVAVSALFGGRKVEPRTMMKRILARMRLRQCSLLLSLAVCGALAT